MSIAPNAAIDRLTVTAEKTVDITNEGTIQQITGTGSITLTGNGNVEIVSNASVALQYAINAKEKFEEAKTTGNLNWDTLITAIHFYEEAKEIGAEVSSLTEYYSSIASLDLSEKSESNYDISTGALVYFTGLTKLDLSKTGIKEIGGLVNLTDLETLDISGNEIEDLGALANMSNLSELNISNTSIKDINVLVKEDTTTRFVDLINLQAQNIPSLTSIAGLVHISINDVQTDSVTWDFSGSVLAGTDAQNHIDQINATKDEASFIAPTVTQ
ncbi:leucine-rich repeat domain-containing protein [Ureibacillus sp. GCM10028918]|uniref:leucine-rich repeat domain-containing protein n=1 Tax=Ureibacillus sp. GCM10028918 TaxID=3273429 RepID=UPI00360F50F9